MSALAGWNDARFTMTGAGDPEEVRAGLVNGQFLDTLGVRPVLGRGFVMGDDEQKSQLAILSHALWSRSFKSDPAVVGHRVLLNDLPYEVVGVMPNTFRFPGIFQPDLLIPGGYSAPPSWSSRVFGQLNVIGRLAPGARAAAVAAELEGIQARHAANLPAKMAGALAGRARASFRSRSVSPASTSGARS